MTTFFFILLGLLFLTTLNRCASTTHDNRDETGTYGLSVQRGRTADISKPLLHLVRRVIPSEDFQLNISGEPWERCGETRPDIVTSSYLSNHTLLFTHFGCKEPLVLLEFLVSSPRRQVRVLNVPLTVSPSQHPLQGVLNGFQIKPVHNTNLDLSTGTQETAYNLTITFSPNVTTDLCLYSFELLPNTFPIPEHGQLILPPNITRIPCGLAPLVPVKYTPRSASSKISPSRDYALVRIWPRGTGAGLPLYGIVDIEFQRPSGGPALLKTAHSILVHHSGYTPVPATRLLPNDVLTTDISKQMRIHVEATDCGVFVSHMTPINLADTATTLLTSPDLISESVAFRPIVNNCSANSSVNAFDISGRLLWSLSISIRVNLLYNISTFDFVLNGSQPADVTSVLQGIFATFGENCTLNLSRAPMQGNLHWTDPNVQFSTASLIPANFTSTLLYTSRDRGVSDGFAFRTECSTDVIYITVFIMGLMKDPLHHSLSDVKIDVFLGYATQLGPHILRMNYEQMDEHEPILVFLHNRDLSVYQILEPHTAETVLPLSTFNSTYNPVLTKNVTLSQWIDGLAWIVPLNVSGPDGVPNFGLNVVYPEKRQKIVLLPADIHAQPPPTNTELFTPDVTITANHPLVLDVQSSHTQWTVISTLNLDVKAARRSVVYNVVIPPTSGSLCFYRQTCNHSLSTFTHEDLRSGALGYYQTLPSKLDGFLFEIDGTQPQWFVIKSNNVIEDPCNVKPIFVPVMSNVALIPSMFASQLVEVPLTNSTAFSVVLLPSQGYLSLQKGNTVTLSDLTSGRLNYEVVNLTSSAPIDSSAFVTMYNNTGYFTELVFVHLKNSTLPPYVHVRDLNTSMTSTELGNNFILTDFPFLVDIVHFVIVDEPIHGQIVHNHGQDSKTTVLSKNCSFSHASLKRGEIQYVISEGEDVDSFNDSLYFVLMLPSILTPVFLPNKTYSLAINYKKQSLSRNKGLSVVSNLTVSLLDKMDTLYKYGVSLNRNIRIPEDMDAEPFFISFSSERRVGSFFMNSTEWHLFTWEEFQNSQLFYFLTQSALKLMYTHDSIKMQVVYRPQPNKTLHTHQTKFTIDVFWSLVYFQKTSIEREVTNGGSDFSFYIKRKGTVLEETYITLNMTGITPGIALTCPNDWMGNNQRICVNESLTHIDLYSDTDQVEIFSTALVDKSVGGFEGNGRIEFQILGDQNAIPLPGNDTAVVRLNEFSIVRIEVNHYPGYGPSNECSKAISVNESSRVLSLQLVRSGNIQNRVGIVCYTKLPNGSFSGSFKERSRFADSSVVYFNENSSTALCNVTIMEEPHHHTVMFIVALATKDGEHARPISSEENVCVYVVDRNAIRKEVFFDKTEYTFDEPDKSNFSYNLAIRRNWTSEKGDPTTTVFYRTTGGTATPWKDYIPIAGKAVHFQGPQRKYYISITLLVDQDNFEPDEYFYIEILNITDEHATSRTDRIKVIIQDDQVKIGFSQPVFTFQETEGKVRIYAERSGNLVNSTAFLCIPAKIGSYRGEQPYKDVISFQEYLYTFQPGQSSAHCTVEINNDEVFDEVKLFEVTMYGVSAKVNRVRLGLRKAIVNITDEEDRQVVQFDPAVYSANRHIDMLEPATNCKVDEEVYVVRVTRTGDITMNTTVRVTSTGSLNHLYKLLDSEALFKRGQNVSEIRVVIKAYVEETDDNSFNLTLTPTSSEVQTPKVRIGEINQLIINIRNYQIKGPLFPAAPVVVGTDSSHPLTCVTPCDNITTYNDTCRYEEFCRTIDIAATHYEWEESGDGVNFTKVEYLSWLASTSSAELDPVFLKPGYHYRCVVSPTSIAGNRGGTQQTRRSQPYHVSAGKECGTSPQTTVIISPFREVGKNSDRIILAPSEVVKITISVQSINNMFPLVSMSRFHGDLLAAQNAPYSKHKCSNFLPGMHSLLGRQAFVGVPRITNLRAPTLDNCMWTFESWHLVKDLVDNCNARSSSNETHAFDLNFYVSYFSGHHSKNSITDRVTKTVLLDQSLNPPPNPLEALVSTSSMTTVRLELLALNASTRSHLEVVLRSTVIPTDGSAQNLLLLPRPYISSSSHLPSSLDLAASPKRNSNSSTQLWVLDDFSENIPNSYNITFRCGPSSGHCSPQAFHFRLVENTRHSHRYQIAISTNFTIRTEGDYTIANLSVSPQNILRENVRLCLTGLTACHGWSKETVDGCMSSKISTIRNVLDLAGLALPLNICSITSQSEYFSQSRLYTEIKFETRKLEIEDSWFFLANYTFVGDISLAGQYHNQSSLKQINYEAPSTPGPTEEISMAIFVAPSVVTMVVTITATVVIVCVVLCTYCRSKNKALESVDCHATYQRSTRVIRTRVTPSGSEEYEMTQIITQKGVDPNLYTALALEGARDKRRMLNNFRSLPQLPVIKEEPSTHDHRVVCTSTERSTADPSPVSNYTLDGEELADHVLEYLAISAPTPSVSRTRLHSDL